MCGIVACIPDFGFDPAFRLLDHRGVRSSFTRLPGLSVYFRRLPTFAASHISDHPVWSCDGRFAVWMNGNIFNYEELAAELEEPHAITDPDSDTEILAHLLEEYGIGLLARKYLDGDFALIIHDLKKEITYIAVDYFSMVPLYYTRRGDGTYIFASELKVLRELLDCPLEAKYAQELRRYGSPWTERTPWKGVWKFPAGCFVEIQDNGTTSSRYLNRYYSAEPAEYRIDHKEMWEELVRSTRLRIKSCLPVIVPLSGGVDSSAVVAAIREVDPDREIQTFSVEFDGYSETEDAEKVAAYFNTEHQVFYVGTSEIEKNLESIVRYNETWCDRGGVIPEWAVFSTIAKHYGREYTVLKGDCPDELFGGYRRAEASDSLDVFRRAFSSERAVQEFSEYFFRSRTLRLTQSRGILSARAADLFWSVEHELSLYAFPKQDKFARMYTLDPRNPWYTTKMIGFAYSIRDVRPRSGLRKPDVREMLVGRLPDEILTKKKQPFKLPGYADIDMRKVWNHVYQK